MARRRCVCSTPRGCVRSRQGGSRSAVTRAVTRSCRNCPARELAEEIAGSAADLEAAGLPRPRMFAYPHGEQDARVRAAVADAGMVAAFTVEPGMMKRGADPFRIPRVEILRRDRGVRFLWKLFALR